MKIVQCTLGNFPDISTPYVANTVDCMSDIIVCIAYSCFRIVLLYILHDRKVIFLSYLFISYLVLKKLKMDFDNNKISPQNFWTKKTYF